MGFKDTTIASPSDKDEDRLVLLATRGSTKESRDRFFQELRFTRCYKYGAILRDLITPKTVYPPRDTVHKVRGAKEPRRECP
ncbi:hypothetical protein H9L39_19861 [Fusarium oxysporum f. sp. albedinis]|nr:hypothetical protein H9L39_19861 [Fusarium oxysporum f. sp. albedinis]